MNESMREMRKLAGIEPTTPSVVEAGLNHIANTIFDQMGGFPRVRTFLGITAVNTLQNGVGFRWPNKHRSKGNYVEITLEPDDTYKMEFFNLGSAAKKSVKVYEGLYFDALVETFEKQTGWILKI